MDLISSVLRQFQKAGSFVDFTLRFGDGRLIKVHRVVLAAKSEFFKDFLEQYPTATEIILQDSYDIFTMVVDMMYGVIPYPSPPFHDCMVLARIMSKYFIECNYQEFLDIEVEL